MNPEPSGTVPHPLVSPAEMQAIEREAFAAGASAEGLMDVAALGIARAVRQFFHGPGTVVPFVGTGHNGGDAAAACLHLRAWGWGVLPVAGMPGKELKPLTAKKVAALGALADAAPGGADLAGCRRPLVVIDGLLGTGAADRPLGGAVSASAAAIRALRDRSNAHVVAVDIPTGLSGTTGEPADGAVVADVTVTIGFPKTGLVADAATGHVGRLALVPLPGLDRAGRGDTGACLLTPDMLRPLLRRRGYGEHKGDAGRVLVVAGSARYPGAAALCSHAAVRGGAGLVTLLVPAAAYGAIAAKAAPEVMVVAMADSPPAGLPDHDVLAVGPGIGPGRAGEVMDLLERSGAPAVVDADALNAIADGGAAALARVAGREAPVVLTPHPGEMARLLGGAPAGDRRRRAETFAAAHPGVTLLLKGARTVIARDGDPVLFNTTGGPAMATGGMGDVLTGVLAAVAAGGGGAGGDLRDAAAVAAWVCGRSAERAVASRRQSVESLAASDVTAGLGGAFEDLRDGVY